MKTFVPSLFAIAALATSASADVAVDWAKGLVTANGVGIADRHAPNPAVARGTSRRAAEDAARAQLAKGLGKLPVAGGGTVGEHAKDDTKARLDRAVAQAIAVAAEPQTDGAWTVTMAVPIEAIRQALEAGPRAVGVDGDAAPPIVIVDGVVAKPAIGWTVGGVKGATIWVPAKELPAWTKDAPHVTSTGATGGAIAVSGTAGGEATLYVIAR